MIAAVSIKHLKRLCITALLFTFIVKPQCALFGQNLILNGSMTSVKGENVVAPNWRVLPSDFINTPDINSAFGTLQTTSGYSWIGGLPETSPDGGTWQNLFGRENITQTIAGLTIGATYYFRYYYCSQGITCCGAVLTYTIPHPPVISVTGASGYTDPTDSGTLFIWNTYSGTFIATADSVSITPSGHTDSYMAYDGFYLSDTEIIVPVIILQPRDTTICNIGTVAFGIESANATIYQWQLNTGSGWIDIADDTTYSGTNSNKLVVKAAVNMNGYQYRCGAANECCIAFSIPAILTVKTPSNASLIIVASSTDICAAIPVTFTAFPENGGTTPIYQWQKNAINTGTNSSSYTDSNLVNGDVIKCLLTSNSTCILSVNTVSNPINITVNPVLTPAISISASGNNICFGTTVTFIATYANEGLAPSFEWKKNGIKTGSDSSVYIDDALNNSDIIECILKSSNVCISSAAVKSNAVIMIVIPVNVPSIVITSDDSSICSGTGVNFSAAILHGGVPPLYQWQKNGLPVGLNTDNYSDNTLSNGDMVSCTLTSNLICVSQIVITSNTILMDVLQNPAIHLNHSETLCIGTERELDAGNFPFYKWNNGSTNRSIKITGVGKYYVTVTDNNGCTGSDTAVVTTMLSRPDGFLPADTVICSYGSIILNALPGYKSYVWSTNSGASSITITRPGEYWLDVTDNNGCPGKDTVVVLSKDCMKGFYIPSAFTPNGDGKNDFFKPLLFGPLKQYRFSVYNRWGQLVFNSGTEGKAWDGLVNGQKHSSDTFVWVCTYQFEGDSVITEKGTVVLIR